MKVPCIICKKLVDGDNENVIATVCDTCIQGNIDAKLKNLDYKTVKSLIPKINKDGRIVNEYGEVIKWKN